MSKSNSQWYPRYVGDYARKTAHLSLAQHGAYTLLMDWYYSTGKPLPLDWVHLHRICTAFAPDEQAAVQYVVENFFVKCADGWHNERADEELSKRSDISEKRRIAQAIREQKRVSVEGANAPVLHQVCTDFAPPQPQPQPHSIKEGSKEPPKKSALDLSFVAEPYQPCFEKWLTYKREIGSPYKGQTSLKTCYNQLLKMADNNPATAAEIVDNSIGNRYQGLFALKGSASGRPASKQMNTWDDNGYGKDIPL